ncbi:DedA family protein [uncultured Clostridium sp.]|uniref:DedA family protein n=1 Tax=uncultured Clostridium sp. TaxID=59620 RepID=UPI00262F0B9D|nr:DedA family protein [uncultured Clostridium sp.]
MEYINHFVSSVVNLVYSYGYFGVIIATSIEYVALPAPPSEVIIPLIGAMAAQGKFNIFIVFLVTVFAGVLGSTITYYMGYFWGRHIVDFIEKKLPSSKKPLHKVNLLFRKYSYLSVYLGRVLPFTRSYISIIAGIERMNIFKFWLYSGLGIGTWNLILILIGYFVGSNISVIEVYIKGHIIIVIIAIVILVVIYLLYRWLKRRGHKI